MSKTVTDKERQAVLRRLHGYSRLMDSAIRIPFTRIEIGVDPVIGLIPVVGDLAGMLLSGYVLAEAHRIGASRRVKAHMLKNILLETVVGMVPLLGDAFDVMYKANLRNTRMLREDLERQMDRSQQAGARQ